MLKPVAELKWATDPGLEYVKLMEYDDSGKANGECSGCLTPKNLGHQLCAGTAEAPETALLNAARGF
jgi:hypothetical protein